MVRYGCINIHASLLPKYRGASPIQHVIIDNEAETGITIMQMDAGIDTGDILYKKSLYLENNDTFETLHDKLAILGGEAIVEALKLVETGDIVPQKQNDEESCYAPIIKKELGNIDFAQSAIQIECFIRGLNPWPSAFTYFKGKQFKIWKAHVLEAVQGNPGEVIEVSKDCIVVGTGKGAIAIDILQIEGKKRMSTHDYLLGVEVKIGDIFTNTR